eukprot:5425742-Heterocapsa_arctica.AAC.1
MEAEGFAQVFRRRHQGNQEEPSVTEPSPGNQGLQLGEEWTQGFQREGADDTTGNHTRSQLGGAPSSTLAGSTMPVPISNRYAQLAESNRAEEVANKADQDRKDRIRDSWDQESRIEDIAHRKQLWHAEKYRKISTQPSGSGTPRASTGDGSERAAGEHPQHSFG